MQFGVIEECRCDDFLAFPSSLVLFLIPFGVVEQRRYDNFCCFHKQISTLFIAIGGIEECHYDSFCDCACKLKSLQYHFTKVVEECRYDAFCCFFVSSLIPI